MRLKSWKSWKSKSMKTIRLIYFRKYNFRTYLTLFHCRRTRGGWKKAGNYDMTASWKLKKINWKWLNGFWLFKKHYCWPLQKKKNKRKRKNENGCCSWKCQWLNNTLVICHLTFIFLFLVCSQDPIKFSLSWRKLAFWSRDRVNFSFPESATIRKITPIFFLCCIVMLYFYFVC